LSCDFKVVFLLHQRAENREGPTVDAADPSATEPKLDHSFNSKGMKTHAPAAILKVAATLPTYTGPLGRFLKKQAEAKAAAATLAAMRANVLDLVEEDQFTEAERAAAAVRVTACSCVAQLQRWFRNVYRVLTERRALLCLGFADGSFASFPVQA
jgi:hypothetical protein